MKKVKLTLKQTSSKKPEEGLVTIDTEIEDPIDLSKFIRDPISGILMAIEDSPIIEKLQESVQKVQVDKLIEQLKICVDRIDPIVAEMYRINVSRFPIKQLVLSRWRDALGKALQDLRQLEEAPNVSNLG